MRDERLRSARDEDDFAFRAESLLEAAGNVMCMYMPCAQQKIEMLVGRDTVAEIRFGGPITQEAIMDVMAHLSFYKKYFPKNSGALDCITPETILDRFRAILAEDREARERTRQIEHQPDSATPPDRRDNG